MRILLNTTNLIKGGALQVASALVGEILVDDRGIDWQFALSAPVAENIERLSGRLPQSATVFRSSPSKDLKVRRELLAMENRCRPDAVFSVFGPAFVRFSQPHLMGCATPWVTNSTWLSYSTLPTWREKLHMWAWCCYCAAWLKHADGWVTESPAVKEGMCRRLRLPAEQIAVVSNTCSQPYFAQGRWTPFPKPNETVRLLCFSAAYPHKCIDLIPQVARALQDRLPGRAFEFVLTLPAEEPLWRKILTEAHHLGVGHRIVNRGPVAVADGPALYRECHLAFVPTVLECFTATYPEAMAMGLPIITSDLDFARAVCGDAAIYFRPRDPADAASQIQRVLTSGGLWYGLVQRGKQVLEGLPTPRKKYEEYCNLLHKLVHRQPLASDAPGPADTGNGRTHGEKSRRAA
jgi:glycosyltransferase involved in cell wall biosynthesis